MNKILLQKEHPELPDYFGVVVHYITGDKEEIEVASINFVREVRVYEIWTKDDLMKIIPLESIKCIDYDKRWSKIVAIRQEMQNGNKG